MFFLFGIIYNTAKKPVRIIIDTNIIISALKSRNGLLFYLLATIDDSRFKTCISVPLLIEYENTQVSLEKYLRNLTGCMNGILKPSLTCKALREVFFHKWKVIEIERQKKHT